MAESKMADFKMADIIKLGKNEWVWVRLNWFESGRSESVFEWIWKKITRCLNSRWQWLNPQSRIQDGCNHQVESECMSELFLCKIAESKMVEFKMAAIIKLSQNKWVKFFFVQTGWIQDGSMKMSGIIKLSENELVWVRVLCKIAESKMAVFKMAANIKLSDNEWVKFFLFKMVESKMAEFKMADIIKLSENEWVWVRLN